MRPTVFQATFALPQTILRIFKARGVVAGLLLASLALSACSDPASAPATPPGPEHVQVSYCNSLTPAWVAFQDGDGQWTRVTPTGAGINNTFQFDFQSNRGGIATLSHGGLGITVLSVLFGSPAELASAGDIRALHCGTSESKTLLGTVAGLDSTESAVVSAGFLTHTQATPARQGNFSLKALPSGPHDLFAARTTPVNGEPTLTRIIVRRDVDLPDSTTLPLLDFGSAEAFAPATATLTINGMGAEAASAAVRLLTGTSEILLSPVQPASHDVARQYSALPAGQLRPGDLQVLFASAVGGGASRSAQLFFGTPSNRTLTLPAPVTRPTFTTVATTPFLRPSARFVAQADYDRSASINYQQGATTLVSVSMTAAYAARTVGGYDLVVPDLSGAAGFDPAWALHQGSVLRWSAVRIGGTLGLGADALPSDGATQRSAFDADTIPGL